MLSSFICPGQILVECESMFAVSCVETSTAGFVWQLGRVLREGSVQLLSRVSAFFVSLKRALANFSIDVVSILRDNILFTLEKFTLREKFQ